MVKVDTDYLALCHWVTAKPRTVVLHKNAPIQSSKTVSRDFSSLFRTLVWSPTAKSRQDRKRTKHVVVENLTTRLASLLLFSHNQAGNCSQRTESCYCSNITMLLFPQMSQMTETNQLLLFPQNEDFPQNQVMLPFPQNQALLLLLQNQAL